MWRLLAGCGGTSSSWWIDELSPDSACYRVDLFDGVRATAEWHDLFACLNQGDALSPLAPLDAALDDQTRLGVPAGDELGSALAAARAQHLDPFTWVEIGAHAVAQDQLTPWIDLSLEWVYGVPAPDVRSGATALGDPEALSAGALVPLAGPLRETAAAFLDDELAAATFLGDLARDPRTDQWVYTIGSATSSTDPVVSGAVGPFALHAAQALAAARSPANDRWAGATGDSARDLVEFFVVRDNPVVEQVAPAVTAMLSDPEVRAAVVPTIDSLAARGHLAPLGAEVAWLASVDVDGTPAAGGEPSALYRFVRLLATNNAPVDCSIDLGFTSIDWRFDNLAVATLRVVADLRPGQVEDLAAIVSDLTGGGLTLELLQLGVDTGVCPTLTAQTLDDLTALAVLTEPETESVLTTFVAVLGVLEQGQTDHLPEFADAATALFAAGGLEPAEEAIRDWGASAWTADVTALVPVAVRPEAYGLTAAGGAPATLEDLVDAVGWLFAPEPSTGRIGFDRVRPWVVPMFAHDGTWAAVGAFARVASDERSVSSKLPSLLPGLLELDPSLDTLHAAGTLLAEPAIAGPALRVAERDRFTGALLAASPSAYGGDATGEVPLGFWGRLATSDLIGDLLRLVDQVLVTVGGR
ncbi:MAG: hypothetical protein ABMA64_25275 [Myxococcota bacterium]